LQLNVTYFQVKHGSTLFYSSALDWILKVNVISKWPLGGGKGLKAMSD